MNGNIPVTSIRKTISYLYLLAFCPPGRIGDFRRSTATMLKDLAAEAGLKEKTGVKQILPEACLRIVAFHQARRDPEAELVEALVQAASEAEKDAKALVAFQEKMAEVAALPGRAKPENRLHRNKGCKYCTMPCLYGYFSLVSEPAFGDLQELFAAELSKPASTQSPLMPVYTFSINHLLAVSGAEDGFCTRNHLANLAYCFLLLSMAKSRLAFPEEHVRIFQTANQEFMRRQIDAWNPSK